VFFVSSCSARVSEFATEPGECYFGSIVRDDFVRTGFRPDARLWLTLDTTGLSEATESAVVLSTSDGVFDASPAQTMPQLRHDSLSLFDFPGGRVRSFLAYARVEQGPMATVVISLMENGQVEVRIMRPDTDPVDDLDDALFGVFRLNLDEGCPFADDQVQEP
jgi:hypothetical protein